MKSTLKRSASPPGGLLTRPSPFHSSVTLIEPASACLLSPRRSKRLKQELSDIEDVIPPETVSPIPKKRVKREPASASPVKRVKGPVDSVTSPSPKKSKPIRLELDTPHPAPIHWEKIYSAIKQMREGVVAAVDTMGCDQAQYMETEPKSQRIATLVSLMLSSQTKDEVTFAAVGNLRAALGGSLTVDAIIQADDDTISAAIAKVGFWRRKTQYVKQTAIRLRDEFDSDVPKTVDELCSLPGVGPKMAFLALHAAWNINVGIGVDVHVHRITNRLGWHNPPTKNPEETRLNLQSWLPKEFHRDINHVLVGFGQTICVPVSPRCGECSLSSMGLCPSAKTSGSTARKRKPIKTEEDLD